jgi:LemA protein
MSKKWLPVAIVGGVVLLFVLLGVSKYNGLVTKNEEVDGAWSQVENVLQRRSDLIPNLVATVKGYAAHEEKIFTQIAEARAKLAGARTPADASAANGELSGALSRLLVVAENYPDLKANANFQGLQDELAGTENRIAVERKNYNDAVKDFNASIKRFPGSLVAGFGGFSAKEYFEAEAGAKEAPKVDFAK